MGVRMPPAPHRRRPRHTTPPAGAVPRRPAPSYTRPVSSREDREYLKAFYRAADIPQGLDPRLREYYVPIYDNPGMRDFDVIPKMQRAIEFSAGQSVQLLSGFRGCGKTSELLRLQSRLEHNGARVVYLDIEDFFNTRLPVDAWRFLIALAAGFALAVERDLKEPAATRFRNFLSRVRPELGASFGVPGASVDLKGVVKDDVSFASEAERAFTDNRGTMRAEFHRFFATLISSVSLGRDVVFIVDSIDHWRGSSEQFETVRESVEDTFTQLADDLRIPNLHVIYTVPIYLDVPGLGTRYDIVNVKLADRAGAPFAPGRDALEQVLAKRAPANDLSRLLGAEETSRLISSSGGHFRDLLRLTRELILGASAVPATIGELARAEMTLRTGYTTTLTQEQMVVLRHVAETKTLFGSRAQSADEAALITLGAILRYPNDEDTWYDVHPLLKPIL
jgi:hypothetical protein